MADNLHAKCKACNGRGIQANKLTGLKVRCAECDGEGNWPRVRNEYGAIGIGWPPPIQYAVVDFGIVAVDIIPG